MTGARPIRVLLVDDHQFFRAGVRSILIERGFEIVGEAENGEEAVALASRRGPDVVLMDLNMPVMSGVEAARLLADGDAPVLMLTISEEETDVVDALEAGAAGYVLKSSRPEEIVAGVEAAVAGDAPFSPRVARHLVDRLRAQPGRMDVAERIQSKLSERELEVLRLLAEGMDNSHIAAQLSLSQATVKSHVSSILGKLEVTNRVQAAIQGIRAGLI